MSKETKDERFKRVAEKRVQNVIKGLKSLSQLANNNVYEWNSKQLKKIWDAIDGELIDCKKSFDDPDSDLFKL